MRGFLQIFRLEMTSLVRSKTLAMLTAVSLAWMFALPRLMTGDGTIEGTRELGIRYGLGGAFAFVLIALLASATGSLSRERTAKRLALTAVRPVRYGVIVLAKSCALTAAGAFVLALSCVALAINRSQDLSRPCRHLLSPVLPTVKAEAKAMYDAYLRDPDTPEAVRKANPRTVLRILENRAADHYFAVRTNETAGWTFASPATERGLAVRVRFAGQFDSRQELNGVFRLGALEGAVSNVTQAILEVPLAGADSRPHCQAEALPNRLSFSNRGCEAVLLRPRKDVKLLVPADTFGWNLLRAYLELVSVLALTVAFGLFLSATLGRPVALFVAMSLLVVGELSSGIAERGEETLDAGLGDRIGYALTRTVMEVTRPVTSLDPVSRLADDACVEAKEVRRVLLLDFLLLPVLLALVSGLAVPRKGENE